MNNSNKKQKALELKNQGLTYQQIADEIGVSKTTVYYWILYSKDNQNDIETPEYFQDEDSLKEIKRELSKLRNHISELSNNNENIPNLVELRKLELEHEYRMEELDNNRRENHTNMMLAELQKQYEELKNNYEQSRQNLIELEKLNIELQNEISLLQETNKRLNEKITELEEFLEETSEQVNGIPIPDIFIDRLKRLFDEYTNFNDEECNLDSLESLSDQLSELETEIEDWSLDNDFDYESSGIRLAIKKFTDDLEESVSSMETEDSDELILEFDDDWIADMQDILDDL